MAADGELADVVELAVLGVPGVGEGRRRGLDRRLAVVEAEAAQGRDAELALQQVDGPPRVRPALGAEGRQAGAAAIDFTGRPARPASQSPSAAGKGSSSSAR